MLKLRIISSSQELFSGSVGAVFLPGTLGEFEILPHHAPIVSTLAEGDIRVRSEAGKESRIHIASGFMHCENDSVVVCVEQ